MTAKPGDRVKVVTSGKTYEGVLMPNQETDSVVIKLDNGYNVGVDSGKVKKIEVLSAYKEEKSKTKAKHVHKESKGKPTISILHTGGTIASKVDYKTGGVVANFEPEEIIAMFPELGEIANIKSRLVAKMFSEDMRFKHFQMMAKAIADESKSVDGIILTHGTDTLGYSAAALAFMLEDINIPVIIVGAQRSSDRGSSDAAANLICAAEFIVKTDFAGVAVCMHENSSDNVCAIMPACKTRKLHTSRRDAFRVVNDKVIARVDYNSKKIEYIGSYEKKSKDRKLKLREDMEDKVGIIKIHPHIFPEEIKFFKGYKGLIIEGTGLGHAPINVVDEYTKIHKKNMEAIQEVIQNGCIVVMTSQCVFGAVQMHVYSTAIDLANAGVVSGKDMLTETAFIKLAWLLGNYKKAEAEKLIGENLRGEINERIGTEFL